MCADRGIYFCHRIYDAKNFREDRKYVTHLPAYHIMQNKENITTIYPEQNIPELLDFYIEKMKTRKSMLEIIFKKFKRKSPLASYIWTYRPVPKFSTPLQKGVLNFTVLHGNPFS